MGADMRNIKGQLLTHGSNGRLPSRKQLIESTSLGDSKSTEASTNLSMDDFPAVDSAALPSTSRVAEVRLLTNYFVSLCIHASRKVYEWFAYAIGCIEIVFRVQTILNITCANSDK